MCESTKRRRILDRNIKLDKNQCPEVITSSYLKGRTKTVPGQQFLIRREVYQRIQVAFRKEGIQFAHRNVTVYLPPETTAGESEEERESTDESPTPNDKRKLEAAAAAALALAEEEEGAKKAGKEKDDR